MSIYQHYTCLELNFLFLAINANNNQNVNGTAAPNQQNLNNWLNNENQNPRHNNQNRPQNGNNIRPFGARNGENHFGNNRFFNGAGDNDNNRRDDGGDGGGIGLPNVRNNNSNRWDRSFLDSNVNNMNNPLPPPNRNSFNGNAGGSGDGNVVCNCNNEAVLLTVKKEGPNKGNHSLPDFSSLISSTYYSSYRKEIL